MNGEKQRHHAKDGQKTCPWCGQVKNTSAFYRRSDGSFRGPCQECERSARREERSQRAEAAGRIFVSHEEREACAKKNLETQTKRCSCCADVKSLELFHEDKDSRDGRNSMCSACGTIRRNRVDDIDKDRVRAWVDRDLLLKVQARRSSGGKTEYAWEE
jgi:uncharacterized Zn finger protein